MVVFILERTHLEMEDRLVRIDRSIAEVTDENGVAEPAKTGRRKGHTPRRIEVAPRCQAAQQGSVRIEYIDIPQTMPSDFVMLVFILLGIGHVDVATDRLDSERRKA